MNTHRYALVMFDRDGSGREKDSRATLEAEVEADLRSRGWQDRVAVVVLEPELESWVWSTSPHVASELGWQNQPAPLLDWLVARGFFADTAQIKPARPKEALEAVLAHLRQPRSSSLYAALARKVGLSTCRDPAFCKFRETLQRWFPASD